MEKEKLIELMTRDNTNVNDNERKALFTIISGNSDLYSKVDSLYDFDNHFIKDDCFDKVLFSSGTENLLKLGFNLYNNFPAPAPLELFSSLDNQNHNLAMRAIKVRFNR